MKAPLLNIGVQPAAVKEARAAVNDILKAPHVDNATKVEALKTLTGLCNVNGTTVQNCVFSADGGK
ncbi:hypothetical protein [Paraburkholderia atlantica]|uniref:hypothetical protein n=1 Tax=Paraburkholderia atlantica TaxID=2654982 RepID=UPI003D1F87B9